MLPRTSVRCTNSHSALGGTNAEWPKPPRSAATRRRWDAVEPVTETLTPACPQTRSIVMCAHHVPGPMAGP